MAVMNLTTSPLPGRVGTAGSRRRRAHRSRRTTFGILLASCLVTSSIVSADSFSTHDGIVSTNPAEFTPEVLDGQVRAIAMVGDLAIVGGTFTQVREPGGEVIARNNIFAFDRATGAIDSNFVPELNSHVWALAPGDDGNSVFVGGRFTRVNGFIRKGLTKLDLGGNRVSGFAGRTNARVTSLVELGGVLYIGGNFSQVKSTPVNSLAALDAVTGVILPNIDLTFAGPYSTSRTTGSLSVDKIDVTPDGSRLVVVGNFSSINGVSRPRLAVIDISSNPATLADWSTNTFSIQCQATKWPQYIRDMDVSPDGTYFIVGSTGAYTNGNPACDSVTRWDLTTSGSNIQPSWVSYSGGDTFYGVTVAGDVVYVGGHMRWMNNPFAADRRGAGAVVRRGIAALDPLNGLPYSWRSDRSPRGLGTFDLVVEDDGLWIGDDTDFMNGEYHPRLKLMPLLGGGPVPRPTPPSLPTTLFRSGSGELRSWGYDGNSLSGEQQVDLDVDWNNIRGLVHLGGALFYGRSDGTFWQQGFDGNVLDPPVQVDLNGLTSSYFPVSSITGMFFDDVNGRLYYTQAGSSTLRYRYFTPETPIVGAQTFTGSTSSVVPWASVRGMATVEGRLYYGTSDGTLHRVDLDGDQPVAGTDVVISTPGIDWSDGDLTFLSAGNQFRPPLPEAEFEFSGAGSATSESFHKFKFPVVAGEEITVVLEWDEPTALMNVFLRDPSNIGVTTDTTQNGSPKTLTYTATSTGDWAVAVKIKAGATAFKVLVNPYP